MKQSLELIRKSKNVAICIGKSGKDDKLTEDIYFSAIALTKYLQNEGKAVGVIITQEPTKEIQEIFKKYDVVYTTDASPLRYVISIDYGKSQIEKVLHDVDEENNKVLFYIEPSTKDFDFDNVEYSQEGSNYDLTITFGLNSFQEMGKIYESADYLFKDNSVITFSKNFNTFGDENHYIKSKYTTKIRDLIGDNTDDEIKELLLSGIIDELKLLEGGVDKGKVKELSEIISNGYDFNELLQQTYFSKSYKNLDLQIKLMANIKIDKKARVIWSLVSKDELEFVGVNRKTLDTKGRIIFNLSSDFDIALAAYEVEKDLIKVMVESNDPGKYSAETIAGVFEGRGNDRHAIFVMKDTPIKDLEKNIFTIIENLYELNVTSEGKISEISTMSDSERYTGMAEFEGKSDTPLTKPLVNGKNKAVNAVNEGPVVIEAEEVIEENPYADLLD